MDIYEVLDALNNKQFIDLVLNYYSEEELQRLADYAVRVYDLDDNE